MFNHIKPPKLPELQRKNIGGKRKYVLGDKEFFSVTTVTGILSEESLAKWEKDVGTEVANYQRNFSSSIGTEFHNICEDYLKNMTLSKIDEKYKKLIPKAHFYNIKKHLDKIDNIRLQEGFLYSEELQLAGQVDCIAEYEGEPAIIDFKTSKKEKRADWIQNYFQQATAYSWMWREHTQRDVQQIVIIVSGLDGSDEVFIRNRNEYIDDLKETIKLYNSKYNN